MILYEQENETLCLVHRKPDGKVYFCWYQPWREEWSDDFLTDQRYMSTAYLRQNYKRITIFHSSEDD